MNKVNKTGFIFEPISASESKKKEKEEPTLLKSRYFFTKPKENKSKPQNSVSDRRKDESYEEYLQRLYDEYFPEGDEPVCCNNKNDDPCSSCKKCSKCCSCPKPEKNVLDMDFFNNCFKKLKEFNKKKPEDVPHDIFDEIRKTNEKLDEISIKSETVSNTQESPNQKFSLNLSHIYSNSTSPEKTESLDLDVTIEKENLDSDIVVLNSVSSDSEEQRQCPSPVFKLRKESKSFGSSSKMNISDTAATPTSVYFSSFNSVISDRQISLNKGEKSKNKNGPGKVRKSVGKQYIPHQTLFQFGFKKERKDENTKTS